MFKETFILLFYTGTLCLLLCIISLQYKLSFIYVLTFTVIFKLLLTLFSYDLLSLL